MNHGAARAPDGRTPVLRTLLAAAGAVALVALAGAPAHAASAPSWTSVDTGSTSHFRGLSPVSAKVVWLGGYAGEVRRTVDGGRTWQDVSVPGAETLQFRDISAFDARTAVAMAAGSGTDSRLYRTADGGRTWTLAYRNEEPAAFFDCMSFSDRAHGLVMSDPVDGRFRILATSDGGRTWKVQPTTGMPAALDGEAGFAASGECLTTSGRDAWFGTGGGATARVFASHDRGRTWSVRSTPITSGPSAGINGLAFRTRALGVAVGGDFAAPAENGSVAATSRLERPWRAAAHQPGGYRSGVTFLPGTIATAVAVGLTGSDISRDGGRTWRTFDTGSFDTVACAKDGSCWASGDLGRLARLQR